MVFSILSYFTISKNYFINYTIPFYNIPNIPKLYFFFILFKYSFLILFLLFLFFSSFSSLSPSTSSKPIPSKITTKNHPNQTSTRNPPATPAKSQQIQNPQQITRQSPIQIKIQNQNQNPKPKIKTRNPPSTHATIATAAPPDPCPHQSQTYHRQKPTQLINLHRQKP